MKLAIAPPCPTTGLRRRLRLAFGALVALLVVSGAAGVVALAKTDATVDAFIHRYEPLLADNDAMLQSLTDAQSGERGFLLTGQDPFLDPYRSGVARFPEELASARALVTSNPKLVSLIDAQGQLGQQWMDEFAKPVLVLHAGDPAAARALVESGRGKAIFDRFRDANDDAGRAIRAERDAAHLDQRRTAQRITFGLGALVLVGAMVSTVVASCTARSAVRPLERLRDTLQRLSSGDLSARAEPGGPTEVWAVADAVNALAAENQALTAAEAQRRRGEEVLHRIATEVREHLDVDSLLTALVGHAGPALGVDRAVVRLLEHGSFDRVAAEWVAEGTPSLAARATVPLPLSSERIFYEAIGRGRAVVIDDVDGDERIGEEYRAHLQDLGVRAAIVVPLLGGRELLGGMALQCLGAPRAWSPADAALAKALAREAGAALARAQAFAGERELVVKLQELDQAKSDFVSSVSHELRTPLTSITGYTELLADGDAGDLTDKQLHMLRAVDRNAQRLMALVDNLLTLAQIESGAFRSNLAPVEVGSLLEAAHEAVAPALSQRQVRFVSAVADDLGPVLGDDGQLERVLLNLLSNAIKFTPPGGLVTLGAERNDERVVLRVSDTGIGIPAEEQDRLFTRFFRSSRAREHAITGTGLGLVIVKAIVAHHSGSITVSSVPGCGTTFTVSLPSAPRSTLARAGT